MYFSKTRTFPTFPRNKPSLPPGGDLTWLLAAKFVSPPRQCWQTLNITLRQNQPYSISTHTHPEEKEQQNKTMLADVPTQLCAKTILIISFYMYDTTMPKLKANFFIHYIGRCLKITLHQHHPYIVCFGWTYNKGQVVLIIKQSVTRSLFQFSRREREFLHFNLMFETGTRISFSQSRASRREREFHFPISRIETRTKIEIETILARIFRNSINCLFID